MASKVQEQLKHVSYARGQWQDTPVPNVQQIPLKGELEHGASSCFIKFPAGADNGWHTHTHDVALVVLEGAYLCRDEQGKELRAGPGEYVLLPAGVKHWSGGDSSKGCVFYMQMDDSFDFIPI